MTFRVTHRSKFYFILEVGHSARHQGTSDCEPQALLRPALTSVSGDPITDGQLLVHQFAPGTRRRLHIRLQ